MADPALREQRERLLKEAKNRSDPRAAKSALRAQRDKMLGVATAAPKQSKSVGGLIGNIGKESASIVFGLPRGIVETVRNPVKTINAVGESYVEMYGPLAKGDVKGFASKVYNNPVSFALDALTVASGGTAMAAKAGLAPAKAVKLTTAAGKTVETATSRSTLRAWTQIAADKAAKKATRNNPDARFFGEFTRAGKAQARYKRRPARANELMVGDFAKAVARLDKHERAAVWALARIPSNEAIQATLKKWSAGDGHAKANAALLAHPKTLNLISTPNAKMAATLAEAETLGRKMADLLDLPDEIVEASKGRALRQIGAEDTPLLRDPMYLPDVQDLGGPNKLQFGRGAGYAQQAKIGAEKANRGVLFDAGRLILDPSALGKRYMQAVKKTHYDDLHQTLLDNGVKVPTEAAKGMDLRGLRIVREKRADRIPATLKNQGQLERWLDDAVGDLDKYGLESPTRMSADDLFSKLEDVKGKEVTLVPDNYAKSVTGEFTRAGNVAYMLNKYPVRFWRIAVLNLRPAWLTANIVGNSLMYAVAHADPRGIAALKSGVKASDNFDELFRRKFAEQASGSFIETQRPVMAGKTGKGMANATRVLGLGLADIDKWYETVLRRSAVKAELAKHPQLRKRVKGMKRETRDYWDAMDDALTPQRVDEISRSVNTALGDFHSLTPFEKNYARVVFPFYAWYRAITGITLKLPLEHPVKANLLADLGKIGAEMNLEELGTTEEDVMPFVKGLIPIGPESGGRRPVINTSSPNPFGTPVEVGEFLAALMKGEPGEAGRELPGASPFLLEPLQRIFGSTAAGRPVQGGPTDNVAIDSLIQIVKSLPQYKLFEGEPVTDNPTLYDRDQIDLLLRYLGAGYGRVSVPRAEQLKQRYG